jgi:hypothetical protein
MYAHDERDALTMAESRCFSSAAARTRRTGTVPLHAIVSGRLDPMPSVGKIITLDEVPNALDLARKSDGPPRIVVHPNGDIS